MRIDNDDFRGLVCLILDGAVVCGCEGRRAVVQRHYAEGEKASGCTRYAAQKCALKRLFAGIKQNPAFCGKIRRQIVLSGREQP